MNCPDCGVEKGKIHLEWCDIERCANCGGQLISCDCGHAGEERIIWSGEMDIGD